MYLPTYGEIGPHSDNKFADFKIFRSGIAMKRDGEQMQEIISMTHATILFRVSEYHSKTGRCFVR